MKSKQLILRIGDKIRSIRIQLWMPIECLAVRSKIDVETLAQIESGKKQPDLDQLIRIADALFLDLIFELSPNKPFHDILKAQARKKATKIIRYAQGTMSLEAQEPSEKYIEQLLNEETEKLLFEENQLIWYED